MEESSLGVRFDEPASGIRSRSTSRAPSKLGLPALGGISQGSREQDRSPGSVGGSGVASEGRLRPVGEGAPGGNMSSGGRKPRQEGEPSGGMQDMVRIKSVLDIYKAVRILVGAIANCWCGSNDSIACYRQVLPGLARVQVGNETFVLPGFLLQDLEAICTRSTTNRLAVTDPTVQVVRVKHPTPYFRHIIVLLKLRWLLRLHSACCELDYEMCSLGTLIRGLQYVALQQHAEAESDSIFDSKVCQQAGSHMNLESVLDDIFDQLQRALGAGWRGFLEYVATCDPTRSLHSSAMNTGPPRIISNDSLLAVINTIFVTCFLRHRCGVPASDLKGLFTHVEMLGLPLPELPPLRRAHNLRMWAKAKMQPTRQGRDRANKKDIEKLAQLDAVTLCAAIELQLPEVMATVEEIAEMNMPPQGPLDGDAPQSRDFASTGHSESAGPPAARVMLINKPQLAPAIFSAVVLCVHHHVTFPEGIRERLYALLLRDFALSREQSERLAIAITQNIDGKRLPNHTLLEMEHREKERLRNFQARMHRDCSHLLVSPLVAAPTEKNKPAKFMQNKPKPAHVPFSSAFSSQDMTRSLPDFRSFNASKSGKEPFTVPLSNGPLVWDPESQKLKSDGLFMKMPALGKS
eukprot:TRINITY_DN40492_c0_g1_i1.p1 TRINITY_DN40492_c0_g1~~TRINITY_DN40492_c0_g1_i1.p1  ORF type:complete len:633 (-),score=83.00 TRINITY_DN40492_c0_g1_i1:245-2143(-)